MRELALFPLKTVLFPGISMPLQIFEPRYLDLVSDTIKADGSFGVVTIRSGSETSVGPDVFNVGVEVHIIDWYQQDNQLLGIRIQAESKFELQRQWVAPSKLLYGEVAPMPREPSDELDDFGQELSDMVEQLKNHPALHSYGWPKARDERLLGYELAQVLPIPDVEKIELLAMSSPRKRLMAIADWLGKAS